MNKKELYYRLVNFKRKIRFYKFKIKNKKLYDKLLLNRKFRNIHSGKRCFVLGNGPSLRSVDLNLLSKEYVFTVNQITRHPDFEKLKTNYHFWADPMFFKIDENKEEDLELLKVIKQVSTDENKPEVFFPIKERSFIKKFKLDEILNVNYFKSGYVFHENYNNDINFTEDIPGFGTVVQWAIIMAIYMGFKEIYLLGCDNTGIVVSINSALKDNSDMDYAYEITKNEKKRLENLLREQSLEAYCQSYTNTLLGYRVLYEYCQKRNIELVNCSSETVIDTIPRMRLEDILSEDENE